MCRNEFLWILTIFLIGKIREFLRILRILRILKRQATNSQSTIVTVVIVTAPPAAVVIWHGWLGDTGSDSLRLCVCLSVCLSQAGIVSKRLDGSRWFLARRLPSTYPTQCFMEILVTPKITAFLSCTLPPNFGLWKFRHSKSIVLSTKLVDGRRYDGRWCRRRLVVVNI